MNPLHIKRIRRFLALALAGSAAFVATTGAAQAQDQVPVLQPNKPYKIKFGHSGQVLNVPNASNKEGEALVTYFDIPGFKNDDFERSARSRRGSSSRARSRASWRSCTCSPGSR